MKKDLTPQDMQNIRNFIDCEIEGTIYGIGDGSNADTCRHELDEQTEHNSELRLGILHKRIQGQKDEISKAMDNEIEIQEKIKKELGWC
jgi:hypothetical protein